MSTEEKSGKAKDEIAEWNSKHKIGVVGKNQESKGFHSKDDDVSL